MTVLHDEKRQIQRNKKNKGEEGETWKPGASTLQHHALASVRGSTPPPPTQPIVNCDCLKTVGFLLLVYIPCVAVAGLLSFILHSTFYFLFFLKIFLQTTHRQNEKTNKVTNKKQKQKKIAILRYYVEIPFLGATLQVIVPTIPLILYLRYKFRKLVSQQKTKSYLFCVKGLY